MNNKIQTIKQIIKENENIDGDYWFHSGNDLIHKILDTFIDDDWEILKNDLENFTDTEHSVFSRAILFYDSDKSEDIYEIFFTEFVLLNDIDDADCLLQDIMYLENMKNPNLELLKAIGDKIQIIRNYEKTINNEKMFDYAEEIVTSKVKKHYS